MTFILGNNNLNSDSNQMNRLFTEHPIIKVFDSNNEVPSAPGCLFNEWSSGGQATRVR